MKESIKSYFLLVFIMLNVPAFSQSGDTVFTVKAATLSLMPQTNTLYKGRTKTFKLVKPANVVIDTITFSGGKVSRKDSFIYLQGTTNGTAMLRIYTRQPGGVKKLALLKEYTVQTFAEPNPNLDGVENDSAIHRMQVTVQGYVGVPVYKEPALKRVSYPVVSFELLTGSGGKIITDTVKGNRLTYPLRDKIDKMPEGTVLEIANIKYIVDADTFTVQKPLKVYLINPPVNKF